MFEAFVKFGKSASREAGPFCFMALLTAHGAVPGASVLPVPAERHLMAGVVNSLKIENYGFMNLLEETGAVPQEIVEVLPSRSQIFAEAKSRIAALATELAGELKIEAYDFMDLLADNGLTPNLNVTEAANDNFFRPQIVPPRAA